jgi:hypothetical protein
MTFISNWIAENPMEVVVTLPIFLAVVLALVVKAILG